jgi:hypothetical protein
MLQLKWKQNSSRSVYNQQEKYNKGVFHLGFY